MIELKGISLSFEDKHIFKDFSLTLPSSGIICLFGPSGCGKTTLFNIFAGLIKPQQGSIKGLEHKSVSYVFQSPRLLPWLDVSENIRLVRHCSDKELSALLKLCELEAEASSLPEELSGGMKQRVSIARALNYNGDILLLDEPSNGLDAVLADKLWTQILQQYKDRLVLLITHNKAEAEHYAHKIINIGTK